MLAVIDALAVHLEDEITRRWELRDSFREIKDSERRKFKMIVDEVWKKYPSNVEQMLGCFLDHIMPAGKKFKPLHMVYCDWRDFQAMMLPPLLPLFPLMDCDYVVMDAVLEDWRKLGKNLMYYRDVYENPNKIGHIKFARLYRHSSEYWRVLGVIRKYEKNPEYPLFTARSLIAAQIECLSGYVDRIYVGTLDSEKAAERYEDWYCRRFYGKELVKKARKRPSDTNPVVNSEIRVDYEQRRITSGSVLGTFVFAGGSVVERVTTPIIFAGLGRTRPSEDSAVIAPPKKRG